MRTIALVMQKGGSGKSTLVLGLAIAAVQDGERVSVIETDPQGTASNWELRRGKPEPAVVRIPNAVALERTLQRLAASGRTLAIIDTAAGADNALTAAAMRASDLCLLPTRPSVADIEASHATVRALRGFATPFAFVLNQAPARYHTGEAGPLDRLGVLALPPIVLRNDHQHAIAAGLGVTEFAPNGKAAQEIRALWAWARQKLGHDSVAVRPGLAAAE